MAGAVLVDSGELLALRSILGRRLWLRLFRNDLEPVRDSDLTDFTPAAFPGYADVELTGLWPDPVILGDGSAESGPVDVTFARTAGGVPEVDFGWLIYGDPAPFSVLIAGRRVTVPWTTSADGDTIVIRLAADLLRG